MTDYRHEWKIELSPLDLLILRQRLRRVLQPDAHAVDGRYLIRSLYFDTPEDRALREKLESMGYELSDEELESVFTRFKDLADKKKNITSSDIEALVLHRQAAVQGSCQLVSHVVNTGHGVPNISCIKLQRGDEQIEDVAIGTGPLDASFKAINRMLQMDVKLESFSLNAVTDGEDAIGEAVVKVSGPDGRSYTGSGLSTDIIESSIRAYVNGINKIMESGN